MFSKFINFLRITALKLIKSPLAICLSALFWILFRVAERPSRIFYPCQQAALKNIIQAFLPIFPILIAKSLRLKKNKNNKLILLIAIILASCVSITICLAANGHIQRTDATSIVSVNYNNSISYGQGISPYEPKDNPAYYFAVDTIARLNLGSKTNPLDRFIKPGDRVLIKINLIDEHSPFYTRPEVVRPIIDMCVLAGASVIQIAEGSYSFPHTEDAFESCGYSGMVRSLQIKYPGVSIQTLNLNKRDYWQWIEIKNNSLFSNSGYSDSNLFSLNRPLIGTKYYSTADAYGKNPQGRSKGWYAMNRHVLDADVIINIPKLKVHRRMIFTGCIKSFVGCLLSSTYDDIYRGERIAHFKETGDPNQTIFNNDIFWRSVGDLNRIIIYADRNGSLRPNPQRKILQLIDGIEGAEKGNILEYGGKLYAGKTLVAGTDPLATDAVACRIMGYDFRVIPSIEKNGLSREYPIGTCNPENICILGSPIDETINHVYEFNDRWKKLASRNKLAIPNFTPPVIENINSKSDGNILTIKADIGDSAVAVYVSYTSGQQTFVKKMTKQGSGFAVKISPQGISEYTIIAQDKNFNTASRTNKL